jgi:MoaA/NifB/PqqE/SkfB family radical SAM enzyme
MNTGISLHLEMSKRCILRCPKCPRTIQKGKYYNFFPGGRYTIDDLNIDHAKELVLKTRPSSIVMSGNMGDPIYHPNLIEFVRWLDNINYSFSIHTNGSGKKLSWWEEFYESYKEYNKKSNGNKYNEIWFGVDGLEDTAHKYRVGINWQQSFDAMCLGVKKGKQVNWQWIPFSFNEHQIDEARKLAKDNGINLVLRLSGRWDSKEDPLRPSAKWLPEEAHDGNTKEI